MYPLFQKISSHQQNMCAFAHTTSFKVLLIFFHVHKLNEMPWNRKGQAMILLRDHTFYLSLQNTEKISKFLALIKPNFIACACVVTFMYYTQNIS